jgi:hypothetical protein
MNLLRQVAGLLTGHLSPNQVGNGKYSNSKRCHNEELPHKLYVTMRPYLTHNFVSWDHIL